MRTFTLAVLALLLASFAGADTSVHEVTGTATYRERMALPANAVLVVQLDRFKGADQATISELRIHLCGKQVPVAFRLPWIPGPVAAGERFGIRAEIRVGADLMFESRSTAMVNPTGKNSVNLILAPAHAPTFSVLNKDWSLVELQGSAVTGDNPPTLNFGDGGKVTGFGGVNRFFGSYEWSKPFLQIDANGMTMMAGPQDRMDLEQRYVAALASVNRLTLEEGRLVLLRGSKVIARFKEAKP